MKRIKKSFNYTWMKVPVSGRNGSMSKNDITGDKLVSKPTSATYADGWDMIYGKKKGKHLDKEDICNSRRTSSTRELHETSGSCGKVRCGEET
jgi:hypothetical protein